MSIAYMNKKSIAIALISLTTLSVVFIFSIGFAKWVLVESDTTNADGFIAVETVDAHSVNKFENDPQVSQAICFGRPTETQIANYGITNPAWITVSGTKYEALSAHIDVKVTGLTSTNYLSILEVSSLIENTGKYQTAYEEHLVGALPTPVVSYANSNVARITLNFSWGIAFNSENPYKYYNSQAQTTALQADANVKLNRLKDLLNGVNYSITLSTVNL